MIDFKKIPQKPGVYLFKDQDQGLLYIGKAKNLKKRIQSHFRTGSSLFLSQALDKVTEADWIVTDTGKDALILERQLIQKYRPRFNIEWRDDKNYFFVGVSQERFGRVFWSHQPFRKETPYRDKPRSKNFLIKGNLGGRSSVVNEVLLRGKHGTGQVDYFGPFVSGVALKNYLFGLRRVFPFRSCRALPKKPCLWYSLGLCAGVCVAKQAKTTSKQYQTLIAGLKQMFRIYLQESGRIEAYDVSNIGSKFAVGSMIVFEKNKPKKSQYRRFKIKTVKNISDTACLGEIISRRLKHKEWQTPDLILLDGGKGQLKATKGLARASIALAKKKRKRIYARLYTHYSRRSLDLDAIPQEVKNILLQIRDEAHRFAITYHKKTRQKHLIDL